MKHGKTPRRSQKVMEHGRRKWKVTEPCGIPRNWNIPRAGMCQKVPEGWIGQIRKVSEVDGRFWKALEGLWILIWHVGKLLHNHLYLV